jgi:CheY-like chemotaxis protein
MNAGTHESLVLNVDDNDGARYAKTRILTRAGLRVIEASTGGDAAAGARPRRPCPTWSCWTSNCQT